ncbi:unnamed protein product, partial [Mesorhabditis belari]|uniref:Cytochrome P450 n=1 Tax=Mesorhabditis belari TaxID=2138241 RepID=A0AAF3J959_9BILA
MGKLPQKTGIPIFGNGLEIGRLENQELEPWFRREADKVLNNGGHMMCVQVMSKYLAIPLDGEGIKPILDSTVEITKSDDYEFVLPWIGKGLLTADGEKWKTRRRMLTPTFHFKMLDGYVEVFDRLSRKLCQVLEKSDGKVIDLFPIVKNCALDIICESAMGVSVNALENKEDPYVAALIDMGFLVMQWSMNPLNWFPPYWLLSGHRKRFNENVKYLTDFTKKVISDRQREFEKGNRKFLGNKVTFLDFLLEAKEANNLTDEDIREEVDTFMFEGHDTTSSGIAWILWCLAHHQDVQENLLDEINSVFQDGNSTNLTHEMIKETPLLDQIIKESARIFPPVPIVQREIQNDFQSGEFILPKGCVVWINPMIIHRNRKVWGDDFMQFKPERFAPENEKPRHPYDLIPFSAGLRNCIGQRFALLEEKVMVMHLIKNYKLFPTEVGFHENELREEIVTKPHRGLKLRIEKRKEIIRDFE